MDSVGGKDCQVHRRTFYACTSCSW